ncbi:MAG: hypothetical protein IKS42_09495 [Oscillospiraceae bacterium]|nr:hypothetical protein [Oscillospiraceae bacterium]
MPFWLCLVIGAVVGGIVVGIMLSQLHTVRPNNAAADYVIRDSFRVTMQDETFLGKTTNRTPRMQQQQQPPHQGGPSQHP